MSGPINQTNQIDEIDQMNQPSLDARRGAGYLPVKEALLLLCYRGEFWSDEGFG